MSDTAASYWIEKIRKEEKAHKDWREAARASEEDYHDDRTDSKAQLYNVWYSTVNTLHARLYSKSPVPDVRRRFEAQPGDPMAAVGKQASQLIERGLSYILDTSCFDAHAHRIVDDFLISGVGVPWIEYEAEVGESDDGTPEIELQEVELRHVPWSRFHWEPGKDWEDVDWVARDHYLTAKEIKDQFGQEPESGGAAMGKEAKPKDSAAGFATTFRVTEIWYRPNRTIYVVGWDFDEPLEVRKDALALQGFFPCPRPMFANLKSHALEPRPDHAYFSRNFAYINRLVQRIHAITGQIKSVGFYDAQLSELASISSVADGTLVPVKNLAERLNTAGGATVFDRVIAELPMSQKAQVVQQLQQLLQVEKQRLDEQTGIADVVMGASDPSETATAQSIKNNWANLRLARKMGEVSRAFRDTFRLMAEVMAEHFTPQTLYLISGMQPSPEALQLLKSDIGRNLAIDVETDSTVALDDEAERRQKLEFLNYVAPFVQQVVPLINAGQLPADLGVGMLRFAVGSFKHGRALEEVIDALPGGMQQLQQMQQQAQQAQQQAQQMQAQMQQMGEQMQAMQQQLAQVDQGKQQVDGIKAQAAMTNAQAAQMKAMAGAQAEQGKQQIDAYKAETDRAAMQQPGANVVSII